MTKIHKYTDEDGVTVTVLVDVPGLKRLIQAAKRNPKKRAGAGPFLVQIDRPKEPTQEEK